MTQESPLILCGDCRTPLKEVFARVKGDPLCETCAKKWGRSL